MSPEEHEEFIRLGVVADMRRWLMRQSLIGTMSHKDRDVIECFLVDFERERCAREVGL